MDDSTIDWDAIYRSEKDFKYLSNSDLNFILKQTNIVIGNSALDIGCGTGQLCRDLFHKGYDVLGIDMSKEAINIAKSSTVKLGNGINFQLYDIEKDQTLVYKYDLIVSKYVFAFINNKQIFLNKIKELMNNNSALMIISPNVGSQPDNKKHIAVNKDETLKLLNQSFNKVDYYLRNNDDYYFCAL